MNERPNQMPQLLPWDEAVRLIAREAARETAQAILKEHAESCPVRWKLRTICVAVVASGLLGGGAAAGLRSVLSVLSGGSP